MKNLTDKKRRGIVKKKTRTNKQSIKKKVKQSDSLFVCLCGPAAADAATYAVELVGGRLLG
jgi:hypothetical protein